MIEYIMCYAKPEEILNRGSYMSAHHGFIEFIKRVGEKR